MGCYGGGEMSVFILSDINVLKFVSEFSFACYHKIYNVSPVNTYKGRVYNCTSRNSMEEQNNNI